MSLFEEGSVTFSLWPVSRVFPSASDYVAGYICYGFGFVFGLHLLRTEDYEDKWLGLILSALHGGLLVGSAARLWSMISTEQDYSWLATMVFAGSWCAGVTIWRLKSRASPATNVSPPTIDLNR